MSTNGSLGGLVHWEEGLFLRPHHLQQMQHAVVSRFADERRLTLPHPAGVVQMELSHDELANARLRFGRLLAVMPGGTVVDVPGNADLAALDLKAHMAAGRPIEVRLAVPLWYSERGNAFEQGGPDQKRHYRVSEVTRRDENTGEDEQPIRVRRLNARLLVEGDDEVDLETMPLLRIVPGVGDELGLPRVDPAFVPACLRLDAHPTLAREARDLTNAVEASRDELEEQLRRGGFAIDQMRGAQFEQVMRLRALNAGSGRLRGLLEARAVSPFLWDLEVRTLLGELAALHPDKDLLRVPPYDHDRPMSSILELGKRLRPLLSGAVTASFVKLEFARAGAHFEVVLTDEVLERGAEFYLGIKHGRNVQEMARLVQDADDFKLMPASMTDRAVRGVPLLEERSPPLGLPMAQDLQYFLMQHLESPRIWERVATEKRLTAKWTGSDRDDVQLALYVPLVETAG